ncbi:hypothetical protein FB451DRAFT_1408663 [Mycena latifolia]|nr:hypothetical protein FB451DRAFT_1408663 [Mycena latifolia]
MTWLRLVLPSVFVTLSLSQIAEALLARAGDTIVPAIRSLDFPDALAPFHVRTPASHVKSLLALPPRAAPSAHCLAPAHSRLLRPVPACTASARSRCRTSPTRSSAARTSNSSRACASARTALLANHTLERAAGVPVRGSPLALCALRPLRWRGRPGHISTRGTLLRAVLDLAFVGDSLGASPLPLCFNPSRAPLLNPCARPFSLLLPRPLPSPPAPLIRLARGLRVRGRAPAPVRRVPVASDGGVPASCVSAPLTAELPVIPPSPFLRRRRRGTRRIRGTDSRAESAR